MEKEYIMQHNFTKRSIQDFVAKMNTIKSEVKFSVDNRQVNAKSIIGLLSANLQQGDKILVYVENSNRVEDEIGKVIDFLNNGDEYGV